MFSGSKKYDLKVVRLNCFYKVNDGNWACYFQDLIVAIISNDTCTLRRSLIFGVVTFRGLWYVCLLTVCSISPAKQNRMYQHLIHLFLLEVQKTALLQLTICPQLWIKESLKYLFCLSFKISQSLGSLRIDVLTKNIMITLKAQIIHYEYQTMKTQQAVYIHFISVHGVTFYFNSLTAKPESNSKKRV